jgi:hypothetical protein
MPLLPRKSWVNVTLTLIFRYLKVLHYFNDKVEVGNTPNLLAK